jgi:putative Mg2+ transporter-C (MgtC) family protein
VHNVVHFVVCLYGAIGLGALIGLERQWRQRFAGLRTNMLVSAGACAFTLSSFLIPGDSSAHGRIVSYVISGVGFLGAGVIFKDGTSIQGLNTAGTVWCSAAVGVLTGLDSPECAAILAISVVVINLVFRPISRWLSNHSPEDIMVEAEVSQDDSAASAPTIARWDRT